MAELLRNFENEIAELTVVPAAGGVFEVDVNGELLFSKTALGRHAEPGEIVRLLREHVQG